jgi:hypothetical protein
MKSLFSRRPSPALGVAVLALFISLGGVSYGVATGSIDSREIKNNTVRGKDIRTNTIRGRDVRESSLGTVRNSSKVDGRDAEDLATRYALVDESGRIVQQTGGFKLVDCFQTNANCYIDAGEDVRNNASHAQIAIQNVDGSPRLSGEIGTAPCGTFFVNCAPPNTESNNVIVVAPRDSTGAPPPAGNRFRFYVFVNGLEDNPAAR